MPTIRFTDNIQRHVECPTQVVNGARVREELEAYFSANPRARGYVLDDQGRLREHMAIFVNGGQLRDRAGLTDPVGEDGVIDVIRRCQEERNEQGIHLSCGDAEGPLFKSTARAKSWTEIEPRGGPFGSANPAVKDEKRYAVDGRVVVNRTSDGGKTFETLTKGLPQEHAYDLVYRHALDIDESGEVLAFGSTTGSLWVTENGGDSWQTVSSNLPPIHSVRFVQ